MNLIINYPNDENDKKIFLDNLSTFKAKIILKSIEDLNVDENTKDKVFERITNILEN